MQRSTLPPDFRYVGLLPMRAGPLRVGIAAGVLCVVVLWQLVDGLAACVAFGLLATVATAHVLRAPRPDGLRSVPMAIVPWGVVLEPDDNPRILRWPGVTGVDVEVSHRMDGGSPSVVSSRVTVEARGERFCGYWPGAVGLEGLSANLEAYSHEAGRPPALDLDGQQPIEEPWEPTMPKLLTEARRLCATPRGNLELSRTAWGYRDTAAFRRAPETVARLRAILVHGAGQERADARPLAALVAALLGLRQLIPDLKGLVSAPHPLVAATAKAACLRLGVDLAKVGGLGEVAAFVPEPDLALLSSFAEGIQVDPLSLQDDQ